MKHRQQVSAVLAIVLVVCFVASVLVRRSVDRLRAEATLEEVLYIPSPRALKAMSLGYEGLLADIYWTRAVQYFGGKHHQNSMQYQLLAPLLDITTTLDPHLLAAYEFGSVFLTQKPPAGAGDPDKAVELVERGINDNPDQWRLYYDLGFIYYIEKHDPQAAADAFERGMKVPNAHPFLKVLAAAMAQQGGEKQKAKLLWEMTYETTEDKNIKDNALKHLAALKVDDDIDHLDEITADYRAKHAGENPATWRDLIADGYLRGVPGDPLGKAYKLMPGGRIEVQDPDSLPFIKRGLPPGRQAMQFGMPYTKK